MKRSVFPPLRDPERAALMAGLVIGAVLFAVNLGLLMLVVGLR